MGKYLKLEIDEEPSSDTELGGYYIDLDPNDLFSHLSEDEILDRAGLITDFVYNSMFLHLPLLDAIKEQYGPIPNMAGEILENDHFRSLNDNKDYIPHMKMYRRDESLILYEYAIVAIISKGETKLITRLD